MRNRNWLGAISIALWSLTAIQTASAQTPTLDQVKADAGPSIRSFFQQHCRDPYADGTDHRLQFQTGMLDGDDQPDLYVDLDPSLLEARQCDAPNVRLTWLSSRGYTFQPIRTAPDSAPEAERQPSPLSDDGAASQDGSSPDDAAAQPSGNPSGAEQDRQASTMRVPGPMKSNTSSGSVDDMGGQHSSANLPMQRQAIAAVAAILVGVLLVGLLVLWATGRFLQISVDRYGYRPLLNMANVLDLLIAPMMVIGAVKYETLYPLLLGGAVLWIVRMLINIRNTSFGYGFALSIVQLIVIPVLVAGGWMLRGFMLTGKPTKPPRGYVA